MTTGEFADLVGSLRRAQIVAAKTRTPTANLEAMRLEREVDRVLLERLQRKSGAQTELNLGGKNEPEQQHLNLDLEPPLASGRDSPEQSSLRNATPWNEQQRARWAQPDSGDKSEQLDLW